MSRSLTLGEIQETLTAKCLTSSPQAVRTAEIADIVAVCFVFGKKPPTKTVQLARNSGIPLFVSLYTLFTASGRLYEKGLPGCPGTP